MKRLLDQIQDKDSILLMYLADELSPAERQEVEQMLAADPRLADRLQVMSALNEFLRQSLGALDESQPGDSTQASIRRASRQVRQYALERLRPAPVEVVHRTIPWMRYGFSVAAAVLIGCLIWWNVHPVTSIAPRGPISRTVDQDDPQTVALLIDTMDSPATDDNATRQIAAADSHVDEMDFTSDALIAAQSD